MIKRALATDRSQPESAWREQFVRYARSKQTVEAFCLSEAVSVASFYGWRTRLRNGRGNVLPAPRTASRQSLDLHGYRTLVTQARLGLRSRVGSACLPKRTPHCCLLAVLKPSARSNTVISGLEPSLRSICRYSTSLAFVPTPQMRCRQRTCKARYRACG